MIDISHVEVAGFPHAVRGMRNSYDSWNKSDSRFVEDRYELGENDIRLMRALYKKGGSERKYLRLIQVWCDITAPLYWWKQFDTYKIGTTTLSTSTMHTIMKYPIGWTNFSFENRDEKLSADEDDDVSEGYINKQIGFLNYIRDAYLTSTDANERTKLFNLMIQVLPEAWEQKRTVNLNYEVLAHMINDRKDHKLKEWRDFCKYMLSLCPQLETIMEE